MIYIGADHGGFTLKEKMKSWLSEWGLQFEDCGANELNPEDDYPDFAKEVAQKVVQNPNENNGILVCRSGGGMVIAANKYKHARAVFVFNEESAIHARTDNDANIASFAGDWIDDTSAKRSLYAFLHTHFNEESRHTRRVAKLELV
jgi:RpiB/LacA/LacB family sugar-phosphate isomerase